MNRGKVRDIYAADDALILVATDRISAFDCVLSPGIPGRGVILTQLSTFWFRKFADLVPNHLIGNPDPQVMEVVNCEPMPVEMVMRAYLTGSTSTSIWTHYENGGRLFCGNPLADGMKKHQKLPEPILTPSTKAVPLWIKKGTSEPNSDAKRTSSEIGNPNLQSSFRAKRVAAASLLPPPSPTPQGICL